MITMKEKNTKLHEQPIKNEIAIEDFQDEHKKKTFNWNEFLACVSHY